jgi:hypothetical protein
MKDHLITFLFSVLFLTTCTSPGGKRVTENNSTRDSLTGNEGKPRNDTIPAKKIFADDTVFYVSFQDSNEQEITGRLAKRGPAIVFHFTISRPASLTATIIPDKEDCNIRITSIMLPGNKTDGPFGRDLKYDLTRKGDHMLMIGHNMMAGDAKACDFVLKLKLK